MDLKRVRVLPPSAEGHGFPVRHHTAPVCPPSSNDNGVNRRTRRTEMAKRPNLNTWFAISFCSAVE